ncbi:MAG: hypothetical protein RL091_3392 [Verrucomicrobiota bacterium]
MTAMKHIQRIKGIVVAVMGGTLLALGIVFILRPAPVFLVIPIGLAILAVEFVWARRWLSQAPASVPRRRVPQSPRSGILPGLD